MSDGTADFILECLEPLGGVSARRFFGGHGLYRNGVMFGMVIDGTLYLKTDESNRPAFEAEGCEPFHYGRAGATRVIPSLMAAPDRLLDEADDLIDWCRAAEAAAIRAAAKAPPKRAAKPARPKAKSPST
ncbi:TfoX/Sxy family protein [Zavarzinia sp. CC-PAN008]|uniref:TfoX/Sxy family protein n=1 Tax=Zavarzinia sp. CC-PAN008 TaxID=3243332 RepID=UPI003F74AB56